MTAVNLSAPRFVATAALVQLTQSEPPFVGKGHVEMKIFRAGDAMPAWMSEADTAHLLGLHAIEPLGDTA